MKGTRVLEHFSKDYNYQKIMAYNINPIVADDLLQEAYISLFERFKNRPYNHEHINKDRMYFYFIMKNINHDLHKSEPFKLEINEEHYEYDTDDQDLTDRETDGAKIDIIYDTLTNSNLHWYDIQLFKIYYEGDKSMRKLAKETNISVSNIFETINRTREYLKNKLIK